MDCTYCRTSALIVNINGWSFARAEKMWLAMRKFDGARVGYNVSKPSGSSYRTEKGVRRVSGAVCWVVVEVCSSVEDPKLLSGADCGLAHGHCRLEACKR